MKKILALLTVVFLANVAISFATEKTKEMKTTKKMSCCSTDAKMMKTSDSKSESKNEECNDDKMASGKDECCKKDAVKKSKKTVNHESKVKETEKKDSK